MKCQWNKRLLRHGIAYAILAIIITVTAAPASAQQASSRGMANNMDLYRLQSRLARLQADNTHRKTCEEQGKFYRPDSSNADADGCAGWGTGCQAQTMTMTGVGNHSTTECGGIMSSGLAFSSAQYDCPSAESGEIVTCIGHGNRKGIAYKDISYKGQAYCRDGHFTQAGLASSPPTVKALHLGGCSW